MLVRRRVEHHLRAEMCEQGVHLAGVAHRGNAHIHIQRAAVFAPQLLLDGIGAVLINIYDNELCGHAGGDLPAQLRADGAAAARHHYHFIVDKRAGIIR